MKTPSSEQTRNAFFLEYAIREKMHFVSAPTKMGLVHLIHCEIDNQASTKTSKEIH
jgi:hypothetical protein